MAIPPDNLTSGSWIWTNPFGDLIRADSISSNGQRDFFRFVANQSGNHTFAVSGVVDSQLRIYDSTGAPITPIIDDPINAGATESVTRSLIEGSWYYIAVTGFNSSIGSYNLSINGPTPFINDVIAAAPTYSGSFTGGSISPAGDIDWFRLVAPAGTTSLSFSTSQLSASLDTSLQLLDANGNSLLGVINNAGAGLGDFAFPTSITAGATYYVGVTSLSSGNYNLSVDFNPDAVFAPTFADVRITNRVDQDLDGYARSFKIEFDVNSNVTGNYYVKIYEDDVFFR